MEDNNQESLISVNNPIINTLAVDDDRSMRMMLQTQLEDLGHNVSTAEDGKSAWDALCKHGSDIDIVVLDREMPGMNGLEVVSLMKSDPILKNIPVIMQTGSDKAEQIREGIDAGVYYYLTKPINEDVLASVISAAVRNINQQKLLNKELSQHKSSFNLITQCKFSLRTVAEAEDLACFLANCYPNPEKVVIGIAELLINGVEHGNLNVGYDEKTFLLKNGTWRDEVMRRSNYPENKLKSVEASYKREENGYYLKIKDCGNGFDWRKFIKVDPSRAQENHGRGIAQAYSMSFDKLTYNESGNEVTTFLSHESDIDW
ncbi:response regulator [Marinagarivorans algicola]|uniref:response regulator n=1 Tax=Marinagarivorans algicola TaxID=1513270 RepID=UPI0006B95A24|nr:response regulator [Marinagarivorans algicola]